MFVQCFLTFINLPVNPHKTKIVVFSKDKIRKKLVFIIYTIVKSLSKIFFFYLGLNFIQHKKIFLTDPKQVLAVLPIKSCLSQ